MPRITTIYLSVLERLLRWMRRTAIKYGRSSALPAHLEMGERGEVAALFHLRREGYVVVARKWRSPKQRGDLDLVAWHHNSLCFIEVKTRSSQDVASAEAAVDEKKRQMLRRLARLYMKAVDPQPESVRFDVLSVYLNMPQLQLHIFKNAFGW